MFFSIFLYLIKKYKIYEALKVFVAPPPSPFDTLIFPRLELCCRRRRRHLNSATVLGYCCPVKLPVLLWAPLGYCCPVKLSMLLWTPLGYCCPVKLSVLLWTSLGFCCPVKLPVLLWAPPPRFLLSGETARAAVGTRGFPSLQNTRSCLGDRLKSNSRGCAVRADVWLIYIQHRRPSRT
jgi:hypothetical protein